ncbi:helix-turn-helix domain-containing protein [Dactylosporangium sp. NPDC051541]|uniref:helix-turn-helix domain-containing protein n=1 Tax=Dactylosporangium sp. NPDC051541 TaxID=3363977 RepID=UPI0037A8F03F
MLDLAGSRPGAPGVRMAGFTDDGRHRARDGFRIVPRPAVTVVLDFGADRPVLTDPAGREHRGSLAAGVGYGQGGAAHVRGRRVACLQLRLSPPAAGRLLGCSPADLAGTVTDLDAVWGRGASHLRERLAAATSWPERFALTTATLMARDPSAALTVDPEVAWAWRRIVTGHGLIRVDGLAGEVGWSRKRLWSRFQAQLGLPPKRAARLIRFDRAVHRLVTGARPARVAADTGYTDQSHLHRDVVAYTGVTPAAVPDELWLTSADIHRP